MSVIIIAVESNAIVIDGVSESVSCHALLAAGERLIAWDGTQGRVTYVAPDVDQAIISSMAPYQSYLDAWDAAHAEGEARKIEKQRIADDHIRDIVREVIGKK